MRPNHVLIPKSKKWQATNDSFDQSSKGHFADLLGDEAGFEYVFANPDTGRPYTSVGKAFRAACGKLEFRI